jgi:hypothetical protein
MTARGDELRFYTPTPAANSEWAMPVRRDESPLQGIQGHPQAAGWQPVAVELIRKPRRGVRLKRVDFPWLSDDVLCMRPSAVEVLRGPLEGLCEILPLDHPKDELYALNFVGTPTDALLPDESDIVYSDQTGAPLDIRRFAFDADAIRDRLVFIIPDLRASPMFLRHDLVDTIEAAGLTGFDFEPVWSSDHPEGFTARLW